MRRRLPSARLRIALPLALCAVSWPVAAETSSPDSLAISTPEGSADASAEGPPGRPRMSLAVGMGATFDAAGFAGGDHAIPAFLAVGGFGDGLAGLDLGSFASSASGRFHAGTDNPVDRLALDAFGVIRPAARLAPNDHRYHLRVLRTAVTGSGSRFALHTGARIELPLTRAGEASELRLRLAVRRAVGLYTPKLSGATPGDVTSVGDSTEIYAALAVIF
jgi:hypothetical protein